MPKPYRSSTLETLRVLARLFLIDTEAVIAQPESPRTDAPSEPAPSTEQDGALSYDPDKHELPIGAALALASALCSDGDPCILHKDAAIAAMRRLNGTGYVIACVRV